MSSEEIHFPYYKPSDVAHPNKVLYTENMGSNYDLLITSPNGLINLNQKGIFNNDYSSSSDYINDYIYSVSVTNGFKYNSIYINQNQTLSAFTSIPDTIARQINIDDFDYDTIFGLTMANPAVIDYNYYSTTGSANVFNIQHEITNIEKTKIGPKLFLYTKGDDGKLNDYKTGVMNASLVGGVMLKEAFNTDENNSNFNYISTYNSKILSFNGLNARINENTPLNELENVWPYKIQYNNNQYYHMLTNGKKTALLTLPYETSTNDTYYLLNAKTTANSGQVYNYKKLDEIVENNYYYIVSYFDTRPTIRNNNTISFSSNSSSLFDENIIQFMPLVQFYPQMVNFLHNSEASNIASCNPVSFTTTRGHILINNGNYDLDGNSVNITDNNGLNPLPLTWDKNLTITTTLNYTCANMVNLSETLTGWNYLNQNLDNSKTIISRPNMPYINVGLLVYIPTTDKPYINSGNILNTDNHFVRFINWLNQFGWGQFWNFINSNGEIIMSSEFTGIYNSINNAANNVDNVFQSFSTPACLCFNPDQTKYGYYYNDHIALDTQPVNFLDIDYTNTPLPNTVRDIIKCVTVMSIPIDNALNTTHTVSDTFTFRLKKQNSPILGDYYYIIGTYIYITKGVPLGTSLKNKHYLGFSPSTNILNKEQFMDDSFGTGPGNKLYNYPFKCLPSFLTDTSNPFVNTYIDSNQQDRNSLMKDMFVTPSLFMTINESVGDI